MRPHDHPKRACRTPRHAAPLMNAQRTSPPRGISLIEVLIVIVLFAVGLLGLIGLQARAQQASVNAEDSQRAALLAQDIVSTMWGAGTVTLPAATVDAWQTQVADAAGRGLPGGDGSVAVTGNVARITVAWTPPQAASGASAHRYVTEVLIP
jgi:type IV pilus assembly protein PilV